MLVRSMRKPSPLRPGDTVCLVSPASPITPEKIEPLEKLLLSEGYEVKIAPNALAADGFLAGSDRQRADDLAGAFNDPSVNAVICTRGGYGCARLMPLLDLDRIAASGKMFVGYSDVTTLHLALNRRGLASIYAPMAVSFTVDREPYVYESFKACLRGRNSIPADAPKGKTLVGRRAEGILAGGCLCLLTDSIGTPDPIDACGKILLIEDVDENPHRIDAMLTHLLLAGVLQTAAGIVIGEMTNTDERCDASIGAKPWREIVRDRIEPLGIPAIFEFPCGHMKHMLTLPLGLNVRLDADTGCLEYLETLCD